jgi:LPXTG-motif cell wall-anchored protein
MIRLGRARTLRASARALAAITVATGALVIVGGPTAAGALTVTPSCDAFSQDATTGGPTGAPLAEDVSLPNLNLPDLGNGTVETGTAFEASTTTMSTSLPGATQIEFPAGSGTILDATVNEVKNIKLNFKTTGAASLGTPSLSGGDVLGASAIFSGNDLTFTLPGKQNGSTIPGGGAFFTGGTSFTAPKLTIPVTAPNTPGTIKTEITGLTLMVKVTIASLGNLALGIFLDCTASGTLGTVTVQAPPPPPPGAPDAVNDNASTNKGVPVTVNVLENDTPDDQLAINLDSLAITTDPTKGSVVINDDHSVTYTPNAGVTGVDSFKYQLCSQFQEVDVVKAIVAPCDTATVSITINDPSTTTTTTTVPNTVAPASTAAPTTVAAAAELPRTGSSTLPLTVIGGFLLVLGLSALGLLRRRTNPSL